MRKTPVTPSVSDCREKIIQIFEENLPSTLRKIDIARQIGFKTQNIFYPYGANGALTRWRIAFDRLLNEKVINEIGYSIYALNKKRVDKDVITGGKFKLELPITDKELPEVEEREIDHCNFNKFGLSVTRINGQISAVTLKINDNKFNLNSNDFKDLKHLLSLI